MSRIISNTQLKMYQEQGYLVIEKFFDSERISAALNAIDQILDVKDISEVAELEPQDNSVVRRIWAPTARHSVFKAMACDEKLLDGIECFIGKNIALHYSKVNMKGASVGSPVEWHQDFSYNPHTNTDLLACLIYLDDADKNNGCLQVMPGSHKQVLYDHYIGDYFRGKVIDEKLPSGFSATPIEAPAGSVIFLHCLMLHASSRNQSTKPQRTFIPSYRATDAFPIYVSRRYTGDLEPTIEVIRGRASNIARVEAGRWAMPFAEKEYNSLYQIQEGAHLIHSERTKSGYFGHTVK